MSIYLKLLSLLCLGSLYLPKSYANTFSLNEKTLLSLAKQESSPEIEKIEASFHNTHSKQGETEESFSPELFGTASYAETNERAIIEFQPIFSPVKQAQLGVRQKSSYGLAASAYVMTDQRSATVPFTGKLENATTSTIAFTMQLDLWKDILGRESRAKLESVGLEKKMARLRKDIELKAFTISLRRLYWSLVANNEAIKISNKLLITSKKQLTDTKLRLKNSVAEADEVARYEAQVASREGSILYLQYQKETFLKQLKKLLPSLATHEIKLASYDLNKTMDDVLACTATIASKPSTPYDYTLYDETVALLRSIKSNKALINSRYADPDVKLFGTVKSTGVNSEGTSGSSFRGTYGGSFNDMSDTNRTGYEVGVSFSMPLGSVKEGTKRAKELYDEKRLLASINATDAQVISTHQQLVKSIGLLTQVIRSQKVNSKQLAKRLKLMRKKYTQARVSVSDLVNDQDALLNSELTTIDTELQILYTLFDYLVIYTETPCSFNGNNL
jgi:outer membrane protein TolC